MPEGSNTDPHVAPTSRVGFGMVDAQVIRDRSLPPMVKLVYTHLATYCGDARSAFPSRATIATQVGISVRTVDAALKVAAQVGLITIKRRYDEEKRQHTSSIYLLHDFGGGYTVGGGPVGGGAGAALGQEMHEGSAGAAPELDHGSTPAVKDKDLKDSSAPRHHADARRIENYAQALERHRHRHTAAGRKARRDWEMDGVSPSWLTRSNPFLGADIENYVDHKWGCDSNVRNLVTDMVHRVQADGDLMPPKKILNCALKEARWEDDEPPSSYPGMPDGPFVPVLAMPAEEQSWYERDNVYADENDEWGLPAAPAAQVPQQDKGSPWDAWECSPF